MDNRARTANKARAASKDNPAKTVRAKGREPLQATRPWAVVDRLRQAAVPPTGWNRPIANRCGI
jgi:hypothetical protein